MKNEVLKCNQIVVLRNGMVGIVVNLSNSNNKPSHLIFQPYCNPITQYDDDLCKKNHDYDIMKLYSGEDLENVTDVWKKGNTLNEDNLVWKRK